MRADALLQAGEERLARMLSLLEAERRLYEELSGLARRKREILIQGRLAELEGLLEEEKGALKGVADVENERFALQCDLAQELGLEPAELTVSRLAEAAGPEYGPRLRESQQALVSLIDDLSTINLCNSELIQQSLAYVNFAMDLLAGGTAGGYGRRGERKRPGPRLNVFSRHA